ncbi:hypothetical protein HAX54_004582 [Datura stramonium]|uniref:Transmembrane protein n=1 Tax=Datura stramonium TaxID=4076 RepID=A0ABS8T8L2_DATST|nr:hypothetical protein [Datura stramonium]
MNNSSAGPSSKARVGASQPSESSLKRKRGMFQKDLQHMMYGFGDDSNVRCLFCFAIHLFAAFHPSMSIVFILVNCYAYGNPVNYVMLLSPKFNFVSVHALIVGRFAVCVGPN